MKKFLLLIILGTALVVMGCTISTTKVPPRSFNMQWWYGERYADNEKFKELIFQYPDSYTAKFVTSTQKSVGPVIEVRRDEDNGARLEIFQMKDFGERSTKVKEGDSQRKIDEYVPKETLQVKVEDQTFDVWLYYHESDPLTKDELRTIYESIRGLGELKIKFNHG